ncbi:hypothetical protein T459_05286 [Capsicum annuum]|uniref:FCP1 homology domain-containing protein n=1 Tax=Capsicum annuum TaxID=4072 RepID=A0A1U8FJY5_CAPAN|nr:uncharacterized protein LOC107859146 isoform X1 [Capsicum annuum]XP_016559541.1 uncharacterized protein LOC107859146 isoform X1 [Capsicum annuum]XP_016559542.1 uncharacterized protein LOC107859146 isoform X1 [Capsicum annuum]XP_047262722.1 uncharacterized protein LOC107859146 isoform X1 [Capsicum annuum]XP_047262723.1 uncharacterized protein LOC107859146 isoform X1 [Capsicum annuum]XP_047262724.1 uncharacterized protein LOC107859146 isoform X1 [Capsicum annuum]XP_047262725.1 uncharacterize
MPSLKMKTNIATSSSKNGLHVCPKSSVISKSSLSRTRSVQNADEVADLIHSTQDVPIYYKVYPNQVGRNGDHANDLPDELLEKQQPPITGSPILDKMESSVVTSKSSSETIFSPTLEPVGAHSDSDPSDGASNDFYVPQLETEDSDSSRSSCELQTCNVSDFYISDMIVSCLAVEGENIYDDSLTDRFLSDYKCEEPNIFTNVDEECLLLPFLEDTAVASYSQECRTSGETAVQSDDSSLYMAIHQLRSSEQSDAFTYIESDDQAECFDPHSFIRNLPDILERPNILPKQSRRCKSITLVLDLDETLVHSTLEHCDDADFTFRVFFSMKEHIVYVKQRPHLQIFLERVAEMFEIVIFTASQSIYAKQLLDILDPDGKIISRRAYRESCIFSDGSYTKDLTVLGVDLAKVVIVDNSPQVFRLQVNNGIPIKSWFDDPSDSALISLLPFLEKLAEADDVRPIIAKKFGHMEITIVLATKWTNP